MNLHPPAPAPLVRMINGHLSMSDDHRRPPGRPRAVRLDDSERQEVARRIAAANLGQGIVSATAGARRAAEDIPALADALARRQDKHSLPIEVREIAAAVRGVTPMARDRRALRDLGGARGHLRRHWSQDRRLRAGERFSFDDATINIAVVIPWAIGGDRCSDRYGCRVGRFQLLLAHDDATSYVPAYLYQIRDKQSYRAEDAVSLVNGLCRDVVKPDRVVFEGGVWQGRRMTAAREALGLTLHDAKGRPNQKLVENLFHRLWTALAIELPQADLARFRGETKATTDLYLACRAGRKDPSRHFPALGEVLDALDTAIGRLNHEVIQSREYGSWIPAQRWAEDLAAWPRPVVTDADCPRWAAAPCLETRTVRGAKVQATAPGPWGEKIRYTFGAAELWDAERRKLLVAFDPQTARDTGATILDPRTRRVICQAHCLSAAAGVDASQAGRVTKDIRDMVRREYRVLLPDARSGQTAVARRETELRVTRPHPDREPGPDQGPAADLSRSASDRGASSGYDGGPALRDHEPRRNSGGNPISPWPGGGAFDRLAELEADEAELRRTRQIHDPTTL